MKTTTLCRTICLDFEGELQLTRKLLALVPMDGSHRGFKPHAKSMPLDRLATHIAELPSWPKLALESELFELQVGFTPLIAKSTQELLEIFDKSAAEGVAAIDSATDEDMAQNWTFKYGTYVSFTSPRTDVVRSFINHLVHHRAQLGVYLRMNDISIPGMYGPSADEH